MSRVLTRLPCGLRRPADSQDLSRPYNLSPAELAEADETQLSPHGLCYALAAKKGYYMRGKKSLGAPDPHRWQGW